MRLSPGALDDHVATIAELLERFGVVLDLPTGGPVELRRSASGVVWFELTGSWPDGDATPPSRLAVREKWRPTAAGSLERWEYAYEVVDRGRDFRRAFHLHDAGVFLAELLVAVHEHCEHPIGHAPCRHVVGRPIRDAFDGAGALMVIVTAPAVPDCASLDCLD